MATRPNIQIQANTQTDVYAALNAQTGFPQVAVGTELNVLLIGSGEVRLSEKASPPVAGDGYRTITTDYIAYEVTSGSPGLYAFSPTVSAIINVEVA